MDKELKQKLANLADSLDNKGLKKEADQIDNMIKEAQQADKLGKWYGELIDVLSSGTGRFEKWHEEQVKEFLERENPTPEEKLELLKLLYAEPGVQDQTVSVEEVLEMLRLFDVPEITMTIRK